MDAAKKKNSRFLKKISITFVGVVVGQCLPIVAMPYLMSCYSPKDFGIHGIFMGVIIVLNVLATFRMEHAIILPKRDTVAGRLSTSILCFCAAMSLILACCSLPATWWLMGTWNGSMFSLVLLLSLVSCSLYSVAIAYLVRLGKFKSIAKARIIKGISEPLVATAFYHLFGRTWIGLSLGFGSGFLFAALFAFLNALRLGMLCNAVFDKRILRPYLHRFGRFEVASGLLNTGANHIPAFFLSAFYGPHLFGLFAVVQRMLFVPLGLAGNTLGMVFREEASREHRESQSYRNSFRKTLFFTMVLSFMIIVGSFVISVLPIEDWFGDKWNGISGLFLCLMVFPATKIVAIPLGYSYYISMKLKENLFFQIIFVLVMCLSLSVSFGLRLTFNATVTTFSLCGGLFYLNYILYAYRLSGGRTVITGKLKQ